MKIPVILTLILSSVAVCQQPGSYISSISAGGGAITSSPTAPTNASLSQPLSVAFDSSGNLLIAESGQIGVRVRRLGSDGQLRTLSTAAILPFPPSALSPDGFPPATQSPWMIAAKPDGTPVLAVDTRRLSGGFAPQAYQIFQLSSSGSLTALAGTGKSGYSGDNGPALSAQFSDITAIASDSAGNIYVADDGNFRIREVSASGVVTTIAGTGTSGSAGDGGPATKAQISTVSGLAVISGAVYFSQPSLHTIRRIGSDGVIETVAGNGISGTPQEGSAAVGASLNTPSLIAATPDGRIIFLDSPPVGSGPLILRTVDSSGKLWSVYNSAWSQDAESPVGACASKTGELDFGSTPSTARSVSGLAADPSGNLAIANGAIVYRFAPTPIMVSAAGVVNAASYDPNISPGLIFAVYGNGLGPRTIATASFDNQGLLPTEIAGTQILVDGVAAPMLYARNDVVAGIVPFAAGSTNACSIVQIKQGNNTSLTIAKQVFPATPAIFTLDASGVGPAVALNEDNSINSASNPIARGQIVVFYATGAGVLSPLPVDGSQVVPPTLPAPAALVAVNIGGQSAQVLYAGAAPDLAAGTIQVNAQVPSGVIPGASVTLDFVVAGQSSDKEFLSQPGHVTIAVK